MKVCIERFKSIKKIDMILNRINIIVGANNSGKSSIIQALQFATSAAQATAMYSNIKYKNDIKATSISQEQLIYAPSKDAYALGYNNGVLSSNYSEGICISFSESDESKATVEIAKGRNRNLTIRITGENVGRKLEQLDSPYCMYVTGLAGIPFEEEIRVVGAVRRSAAKGDSNTVFRNVLYLLSQDTSRWQSFIDVIKQMFPDIELSVIANPNISGEINVSFIKNSVSNPIDLAGTGILQTIQIGAYLFYFEPKLLLLDEPDSHLHPDNQKKLARFLDSITENIDTKIILSTHSRHLLSSFGSDANFYLVKNGSLIESNFSHYSTLLELGALDKYDILQSPTLKYVILTEDKNYEKEPMLNLILLASGFASNEFIILSYESIEKINSAMMFASFVLSLNPEIKVIIHRDRDVLFNNELESEIRNFTRTNINCFITALNDLEMYFCCPSHVFYICNHLDPSITQEEIFALVDEAKSAVRQTSKDKLYNVFCNRCSSQRRVDMAQNLSLFEKELTENPDLFIYGKLLYGKIRSLLHERFHLSQNLTQASDFISDSHLADLR